MNEYEVKVYEEVILWKHKIAKRSGMMARMSKKAQSKITDWIPDKVHQAVTESVKTMVKATLNLSTGATCDTLPICKALK